MEQILLALPNRIFAQVAGFRNMYSGELSPIPDYETEETPSLRNGWKEEDVLRIFNLCTLLNNLEGRDRGIALNAVYVANPRFYHVLKHEFEEFENLI